MDIYELTEMDLESIEPLLTACEYKPLRYLPGSTSKELTDYWLLSLKELSAESRVSCFLESRENSISGILIWNENPWETKILGQKAIVIQVFTVDEFNIDKDKVALSLLDKLIKYARKNGIKFILCKTYTNDLNIIHALELNGFLLMDTMVECLYDYQRTPFSSIRFSFNRSDVIFRQASLADRKELESVAGKAFQFHFGRFNSDPRMGRGMGRKVYEQWMNSSLDGYADWIHLAQIQNRIAGFSVWKKPSHSEGILRTRLGHCSITGIHPDFQGRGLFTALTFRGMETLEGIVDVIEGPTHINNYRVQAGCARLGWQILVDARHSFHKWID